MRSRNWVVTFTVIVIVSLAVLGTVCAVDYQAVQSGSTPHFTVASEKPDYVSYEGPGYRVEGSALTAGSQIAWRFSWLPFRFVMFLVLLIGAGGILTVLWDAFKVGRERARQDRA